MLSRLRREVAECGCLAQLWRRFTFDRKAYRPARARMASANSSASASEPSLEKYTSRSDRQGQGVGKALIDHGLAELERAGVRFVVTYGDPTYDGRYGFEALDPERVVPPQVLSQPVGWIGRGLAGEAAACFEGRCRCVLALDDPSLW